MRQFWATGVFLNFNWRDCYWSCGCSILESKRESIKNALEDLEKSGGSVSPNKKYVVRSRIEKEEDEQQPLKSGLRNGLNILTKE